ncbi:MAG: ADP-ribose pyrophosphatase [Methylothermaceae bacteria B42]|nr:MAG: ADP-ribose pyrophosphatase [Methylothermaceae bacteria B42]HHJ38708.1 NUDIX domain-containing protein [Methylothermaceae bacterium]
MNFCPHCGAPILLKVPEGDDRERHVCSQCGKIHYLNPKIIAGCILEWEEKILLCRRAIEPKYGLWTLPAGFMEMGETLEQAARRETLEEACAEVGILELHTIISLPHLSQVYVFFRGKIKDGNFAPGAESLETQLFTEAQIPWDELAFETVRRSLETFLEDRKAGRFKTRVEDLWLPKRHKQGDDKSSK